MEIKGVIFDLDGVLCSTDRFHFAAWQSLAQQLSIPFTEADNPVGQKRRFQPV